MNNEIFQQARSAYDAKDYEAALSWFTECLQDTSAPLAPGEMGLLYHQIGNCLSKLDDYAEAIHAYTQATVDSAYDAAGTVSYNLGMAYAKLHDYEDALQHFEIAVSDAKYPTPYKAYSGMGNALMKLGKSAEAGVAFRQAALDEGNPDPTKALLNLGVCFMAIDRPADAVTSYESALQFDMSQGFRNKLFANLGQAYFANGQMSQAVTAFESALADKTYFLSDSASVDYQRAVGAVATGASEMTAQMAPIDADTSGLDVTAEGMPLDTVDDAYAYRSEPYYRPEAYGLQDQYATSDDRFFNASDEELEQWSKGIARQDRKRRNIGLKVLIVIIVLVLIALGAGVFLYWQGFGYPDQETVVQSVFTDPGNAPSAFSDGLSSDRVDEMLAIVVDDDAVTIQGVNKSMSESTVYASATTPQGEEVNYKISLVRDAFSWKVSNIELNFASQN